MPNRTECYYAFNMITLAVIPFATTSIDKAKIRNDNLLTEPYFLCIIAFSLLFSAVIVYWCHYNSLFSVIYFSVVSIIQVKCYIAWVHVKSDLYCSSLAIIMEPYL